MASGLPESTPLEGNSVPRGAAEKPSTDLRRPCGPDPGSATALLAHAYGDALAPLLVASPGSGPPGSPNLSPKVFGRASALFDQSELARLDDRFQLGMDAQLAAQAADVGTHGRVADPQPARDIAAGSAFGHHAQHLFLSRRQSLELGLRLPSLVEHGGE